ncbi:MAG: MBL fold metallo-hydrolase [Candidatus Diapherotrites archaeon]|nr:MBL fold metallo-hydrolase [Candidatus Diapherotrites archaeon]
MNYLRYWGHNFIEVNLDGTPFVFDPFMDNNPASEERVQKCPITPGSLNDVAVIFITGEGFDQFDQPNVEALARSNNSLLIAPGQVTEWVDLPANLVYSHGIGDQFNILNLKVDVIESMSAASGYSVGYIVSAGGRKIYHAGNTRSFRQMANMNGIDIAFLPIGGHGVMDVVEAISAAKMIKPQYVVPMHYNTFSNIKADTKKFVEMMEESAPSIQVVVPELGEKIEF